MKKFLRPSLEFHFLASQSKELHKQLSRWTNENYFDLFKSLEMGFQEHTTNEETVVQENLMEGKHSSKNSLELNSSWNPPHHSMQNKEPSSPKEKDFKVDYVQLPAGPALGRSPKSLPQDFKR